MSAIAPESIAPLALPSLPLVDRRPLPNCSAVYLVLEGETVIYVGQSTSLILRWQQHDTLKQLKSRGTEIRLAWLECSAPASLKPIDGALIQWFRPELNEIGKRRIVPPRKRTIYGQNKKPYQLMLTPEASDLLDMKAEQLGITRSELIERIIRCGGLDTADKFEVPA